MESQKISQKKKTTKKGRRIHNTTIRNFSIKNMEQSTSSRTNNLKFINKPLSNFALSEWVNKLKIKHFRGIYNRDRLPNKIDEPEVRIINLDTHIGPGTHWVCYRNDDKHICEYFDSFGLKMPSEIQKYLQTSGEKIIYSTDEIQERDSVLCSYWCLYYLLERQKGKSILDIIRNAALSQTDKSINHKFIINYFKSMSFIYIMVKSYCVKQKKQTECIERSGYKKVKKRSINVVLHMC